MSKANIQISKRDLELMLDIYENVFLAFYQIHLRHFKNRAKPTVYNRLSKLTHGGFIKPLRVNLKAFHKNGEDIGVIYQITPMGLSLLKLYRLGEHLREDISPINFSTLYHDLVLTDVLEKLRVHFGFEKIKNSKLLKLNPKEVERIPDAVACYQKSDQKIAIELELSAKSEKRYREIISQYRLSSEFEKIIYIISNDQILKKVGGEITGFRSKFELGDDTGKFHFVLLKELLSESFLKIKGSSILSLKCKEESHQREQEVI